MRTKGQCGLHEDERADKGDSSSIISPGLEHPLFPLEPTAVDLRRALEFIRRFFWLAFWLVAFTSQPSVAELHAQTPGAERWEFVTGNVVWSSPAIEADGTAYVGFSDGKVYALKGSARLADSPWPMQGQNAQHTGRASSIKATALLPSTICWEAPTARRRFLRSTSVLRSMPRAGQALWPRRIKFKASPFTRRKYKQPSSQFLPRLV